MALAEATLKIADVVRRLLHERWTERERKWIDATFLEAAQVATAVATAWLSVALGKWPLDTEVQDFIRNAVDDPAFPSRLHRLFSEMVNTPSKKRRARLAAVLFGGPHATATPEERDRLDVLVQQLLDEDVDALHAIERMIDRAATERQASVTGLALIGTPEKPGFWWTTTTTSQGADRLPRDSVPIPEVALMVLSSVGCITFLQRSFFDAADAPAPGASRKAISVYLTPLGRFVLDRLRREPIPSGERAIFEPGPSGS